MTREEIIKLARQSGNVVFSEALVFGWAEVERFVALIEQRAAAAEREACAKIVEPSADHRREPKWYIGGEEAMELLIELAAKIRARGKP